MVYHGLPETLVWYSESHNGIMLSLKCVVADRQNAMNIQSSDSSFPSVLKVDCSNSQSG